MEPSCRGDVLQLRRFGRRASHRLGLLTLVTEFSPIQLAFYAVDPRSALLPASLVAVSVVTAAGFAAAAFSSLRFTQPLTVYEMTLPYLESDPGAVSE